VQTQFDFAKHTLGELHVWTLTFCGEVVVGDLVDCLLVRGVLVFSSSSSSKELVV